MNPQVIALVGSLAFGVIGVWRSWLQWRRYGTPGIHLFKSNDAGQIFRDGIAIVVPALMPCQAAIAILWPDVFAPIEIIPATNGTVAVIGTGLLLFGSGVLVHGNLALGPAWRIGIEEGARPPLVTAGIYGVIRNPIFVSSLIVIVGYAVLLPTWLSLAFLGLFALSIVQQAAVEEVHLLRTYGVEYYDYANRVGRFAPGLGRLMNPNPNPKSVERGANAKHHSA
jgi:protein-S-isoprenylcysteine O-methyltransferase Ste14